MRILIIFLLLVVPALAQPGDADVQAAGKRLWQNECGGRIDGLTSWNHGESFASLGIGHFIWYPAGQEGPFQESFPKLVEYLKANGAKLPAWLETTKDCPWNSRDAFMADFNGPRLKSLRRLLSETTALQARFAAQRLSETLPKIMAELEPDEQEVIRKRFERVRAKGIYPLLDYVNFKGEGTSPKERYHGQGWGLLQVLQEMRDEANPLADFSKAADRVLTRRVQNSPPERGESRWLQGWRNRVNGYAQ
ncbi:MAG: hypothetical protein KC910_13440 [Candidatus Eremiobacteraeota bacterium]|nr:hypothetical protein [Candidatus Eremiobacteraeota bacterium]